MATVTYVTNHNDWEALYVDGEMERDGHSIGARDWEHVINNYNITEMERGSVEPGKTFPSEW